VTGRLALAFAVAAVVAAPAVAPAASGAPKPRTITVADNYYGPSKLTVRARTKLTWRWPGEAGDVHDVKLKSARRGVKRFHSEPASSGYRFSRTVRTPGLYRIVCTLHEEMKMTVRVRR